MPKTRSLRDRIATTLRAEIGGGKFPPGTRLPSETQLAERFEVSRPTVRAAIQELNTLGLVHTRQGAGSFVAEEPTVQAGLERMDSITASIRATGREPGMEYASRVRRQVLPQEAARMGVQGDAEVLELRRTILADGIVLAYSYDLVPAWILPPDLDAAEVDGSLFTFLQERLGIVPVRGVTEIHATHNKHIGWGEEARHHDLFVLLNQLHYDARDRLVLASQTYFIEGRYTFTIVRQG